MIITPEILKTHNITEGEYALILKHMGREPNLVELGIFSVLWSEHCSYKSSRKLFKNFPTSGPRVLQGPGENAGIVDIGDGLAVVFKMESHNHPSFIEPYQGAATGVGGILRDVFTMGARPIAILNSLRFGEVNHPKTPYLVSGVVSGIAGYGNCMGIPTVGGEVYFDACYNGNILVNAMTVGLVPHGKIFKGIAAGVGNPLMYVGSKTGRDGIHGATMASDVFDESAEQKRPTVQVGDPFTEKKLLEACLELMNTDAVVGIQDMGAAGLTSSSFEMAARAGTGLIMNLDLVPQRETGMTPYEMMLSESQERMLLVCHKGREEDVRKIFTKWDLDCSVIGEVTDTGRVVGYFGGEISFDLPVTPLVSGAPAYERPRAPAADLYRRQTLDLTSIPESSDLKADLKKLISSPNLASKKWVYRQYDHQVMTNTVFLPGSDAAVVRVKGTSKGLAMTTNCNSRYVYLEPRVGAAIAVAESGRNIACTGAVPLAVTDCLNYGNPERPEIMSEFEEGVLGIAEACRKFDTPVIGGNVSLYNETNGRSIYPTPTIGMVGLLENIDARVDSFFCREGDVVVLLGETFAELGGSEYLKVIHDKVCGKPPALDLTLEKALWDTLLECNGRGTRPSILTSAHDCSEGGLAVTLAECCFGSQNLGAELHLESVTRADVTLFSESQSRAVVTLAEKHLGVLKEFARKMDIRLTVLGKVIKEKLIISLNGKNVIDAPVSELKDIWQTGFEKNIFGMEH